MTDQALAPLERAAEKWLRIKQPVECGQRPPDAQILSARRLAQQPRRQPSLCSVKREPSLLGEQDADSPEELHRLGRRSFRPVLARPREDTDTSGEGPAGRDRNSHWAEG